MKHFVIVAVLVAIMTVLVDFGLRSVGLLPVEASTQAVIIDRLFNTHFSVISFLFSLIVVFLGYSLIVFRQRGKETTDGSFFKNSTGLEVVWTIVPLAAVIYFSYMGSLSLAETRKVDPQALEVKVTGRQWSWTFEYPDYGITSDTLELPVNRQVLLTMTSEDVIHSFWVPEFRVKQDLLPGANLVKQLRITPTVIGSYKVRCAELCGTLHAYMESPVVVVSTDDFQSWVDQQVALLNADPATRGEQAAKQNGCFACHSVDGSKLVGPTWKGLFGSQSELADGSSVPVDEVYLKNSIIKPNAQVVAGFPPGVMPQTYIDSLSEVQISDIIAFIKTLK
ncbi:cytochrome c oxidase subunit II, partial [bacterium]